MTEVVLHLHHPVAEQPSIGVGPLPQASVVALRTTEVVLRLHHPDAEWPSTEADPPPQASVSGWPLTGASLLPDRLGAARRVASCVAPGQEIELLGFDSTIAEPGVEMVDSCCLALSIVYVWMIPIVLLFFFV